MPGNPRQIYRDAERRFPVRVRIAVPEGGFGRQFAVMHDWLDAVCGEGGWSSAPAGLIAALLKLLSRQITRVINPTGSPLSCAACSMSRHTAWSSGSSAGCALAGAPVAATASAARPAISAADPKRSIPRVRPVLSARLVLRCRL